MFGGIKKVFWLKSNHGEKKNKMQKQKKSSVTLNAKPGYAAKKLITKLEIQTGNAS